MVDRKRVFDTVSGQREKKREPVPIHAIRPPAAMSAYIRDPNQDRSILRFFVPADGTIFNFLLFIEDLNVKEAEMVVRIDKPDGSFAEHKTQIKQGMNDKAAIQFPVEEGDRITLSIPTGAQSLVVAAGIWAAFLYRTDIMSGEKTIVDRVNMKEV